MEKPKVYRYRWVILVSMIPILATTNLFWLTFAPITRIAEDYYNVSSLSIAFLSICFMGVYIIMTLPASWLVDTYGFRIAVAVGAIITAVFGLSRGFMSSSFTIVVISQIGVAIGQPFLTNSITKAAARWFPVDERATATGIASMATYIGMIIALVLTPILTDQYGLESMLSIYGIVALISACIFLILSKEHPPTSPSIYKETEQTFSFKGLQQMLHKRDFIVLMACVFIVMGVFNAVMTWIENILSPRGITPSQAGIAGGVLVILGLVGAVILPIISDRLHQRRLLLIIPLIASIPGFIGLTFFHQYSLILLSCAFLGFFMMGVGPIAFQYGAEIANPIPEGTSYGMLMLMGQISGVIFTYSMDAFRVSSTGSLTPAMIILISLMLIGLFLTSKLNESTMILSSEHKEEM
ncbi:MFS transporter [Cytobacillus sp. Hm23]